MSSINPSQPLRRQSCKSMTDLADLQSALAEEEATDSGAEISASAGLSGGRSGETSSIRSKCRQVLDCGIALLQDRNLKEEARQRRGALCVY